MDNKSLGVGLVLTMALSMHGHAKAEDVDLTLRCRGTEVRLYTSKRTYITDPPETRKVDFSVEIHQRDNYLYIFSDGDETKASVGTSPQYGINIINKSDDKSWNIENLTIDDDGKMEQRFYINRLSGRLSYRREFNTDNSAINTSIEAECSKLSPEARKF